MARAHSSLDRQYTKDRNGRRKFNQYFTPRPIVKFALSLLPSSGIKTVIDPAVGDAAFLLEAQHKWPAASLFGIDLDSELIRDANVSPSSRFHLFAGDGLSPHTFADKTLRAILDEGGFDVVLGNPPFSSWFERVADRRTLSSYRLARRADGELMSSQAAEILFLEQFLSLAKPCSWIAIVLPDGVLGNPKYQAVRDFVYQRATIKFVVSLPRFTFAGTSAKTSLVILQKGAPTRSGTAQLIQLGRAGEVVSQAGVPENELRERMDFEFHARASKMNLSSCSQGHFAPLATFVASFRTGRTQYGTKRIFSSGGVRFLHATNITEIGINYARDERFIEPSGPMDSSKAHVRPGEILLVRVGAGCAGRTAMVADSEDIGVASDYLHIMQVQGIDPYFLVAYLKTPRGKAAIDLRKHGVATVSLNKTDVLSLPVPLLPRPQQLKIGREYRELLLNWRSDPTRGGSPYYTDRLSLILDDLERQIADSANSEALTIA